ncbi:hypothetical protein AAFF_G00056630 [Aldrovandia affinis]|uniref:Uncharacterized protein n=1 Tax=Aldrovandia affinis TaxID=143900 RepID=A0AAD7WED9_9TELE|nr:hypothetical protein AAFF_G00056630 [Aldrovandia affinis]
MLTKLLDNENVYIHASLTPCDPTSLCRGAAKMSLLPEYHISEGQDHGKGRVLCRSYSDIQGPRQGQDPRHQAGVCLHSSHDGTAAGTAKSAGNWATSRKEGGHWTNV